MYRTDQESPQALIQEHLNQITQERGINTMEQLTQYWPTVCMDLAFLFGVKVTVNHNDTVFDFVDRPSKVIT